MNGLGLLATLTFLLAAINLTIQGEFNLACGAFFVSFCSMLNLKSNNVIFFLFYTILCIKTWREAKQDYLLIGVSLTFMIT